MARTRAASTSREPRIVLPAGHERVGVLDRRRRARVDSSRVRLPLLCQLAEAVEGTLHFVDDRRPARVGIAGEHFELFQNVTFSL
jgi:hypothetical protein